MSIEDGSSCKDHDLLCLLLFISKRPNFLFSARSWILVCACILPILYKELIACLASRGRTLPLVQFRRFFSFAQAWAFEIIPARERRTL